MAIKILHKHQWIVKQTGNKNKRNQLDDIVLSCS